MLDPQAALGQSRSLRCARAAGCFESFFFGAPAWISPAAADTTPSSTYASADRAGQRITLYQISPPLIHRKPLQLTAEYVRWRA